MQRAERLLLLVVSLAAAGCTAATRSGGESAPPIRLVVHYTNDEHGWLEGESPGAGAASLHAGLRARARAADGELRLSGGDNWTGPAISTWFEGEPVVEVMNAMGYDAVAVGNHEFDFGLEALRRRASEADFPYLAANMRRRSDGGVPVDLGIRSHVVLERAGLKIGVIGLITTATPLVTNPANVRDFDFIDYERSLREAAAAARGEGAQVLVVLAHVCIGPLRELAVAVEDLEVAVFGGGHCNQSVATEAGGAQLVSTRGGFGETAAVSLALDARTGRVLEAGSTLVPTEPRAGGAEIEAIVARWRARTDERLGEVVGVLPETLPRRSDELEQLIVGAWLEALPGAEVALMNRGGIRADLPGGEVTLADLIAVLPFRNTIIQSEVRGDELARAIARHAPVVGGRAGPGFDPERRYRVLSNSFCYAGGDGWTFLAEQDPQGYDTSIHFRQPLIDWFKKRR